MIKAHCLLALCLFGAGPSARASAAPVNPGTDMEMRELSPREWLRRVQESLGQRFAIDPSELRFSPAPPKLAAFLRGPPAPSGTRRAKPARPRRYDIVVVDVTGQKRAQFRAVAVSGSDEPPKDLRFLNDERLVYEVVQTPPAKHPAEKRARGAGQGTANRKTPAPKRSVARQGQRIRPPSPGSPAADPLPQRLLVIQPIGRRARPIRCQGVRFGFAPQQDRLAFVGGKAEAGFVSVNGVQVYPRRGRSIIASDLVWSRDGLGLAFLETPAGRPARLVLLGAYDNPRQDTVWELPPSAVVDGARVFWTRPGKLVVGKTAAHPLFTASFARESTNAVDEFTP